MATRKKQDKKQNLVVNQISVKTINRIILDIQKWRNAHKGAEASSHNRKALYDIYRDVLIDGHLAAVINKRILAITNSQLKFYNDKGEEVEELSKLTKYTFFEKLLTELMNTKFWGYTLLELDWQKAGNELDNITHLVNRAHVKPEFSAVVINDSDTAGINYKDVPYSDWCVWAGDENDFGILLKAALWVIYKRKGFGHWAEFTEIFGMPTRIGEYEDDETRDALNEVFSTIGAAGSITIPKGANVRHEAPSVSGNATLYEKFIDACNAEISITVLGQTMTTTEATSSGYAQSSTHANEQTEIHKADKEYILRILNERLNPILDNLGYKVSGGSWGFENSNNLSLTDRIAIDTQVAQIAPVDDDYFYKTYHIPKPENYEALKKELQASKQPGTQFKEQRNLSDFYELSDFEFTDSPEKKQKFLDKFLNFFFSR